MGSAQTRSRNKFLKNPEIKSKRLKAALKLAGTPLSTKESFPDLSRKSFDVSFIKHKITADFS